MTETLSSPCRPRSRRHCPTMPCSSGNVATPRMRMIWSTEFQDVAEPVFTRNYSVCLRCTEYISDLIRERQKIGKVLQCCLLLT